jgi:pimeloyl-ACP methyl ester carboxylesterase/putative sterol carrier protein
MRAADPRREPEAVRAAVAESLASLPSRYRMDRAPESVRRYRLRIGDTPPAVVVAAPRHCRLAPSVPHRVDAELWIDADAWLELETGRTTGPQALLDGRVALRGDLNEALRLETLFSAPDDLAAPRLWTHEGAGGRMTVHEVGPPDGLPVLAVHGLGASKVSLLPAVAGLAAVGHRVLAPDLPGFGASDPLPSGRYTHAMFAEAVLATLDAAGADRAFLVGNSLGGRVALEAALATPHRVAGLGLLCSAVAFDEYALVRPLLRALRVDGALGRPRWPLGRSAVDRILRRMFADPSRVPRDNLTAAREDFLRSMRHAPRRRAARRHAAPAGAGAARGVLGAARAARAAEPVDLRRGRRPRQPRLRRAGRPPRPPRDRAAVGRLRPRPAVRAPRGHRGGAARRGRRRPGPLQQLSRPAGPSPPHAAASCSRSASGSVTGASQAKFRHT